MCGDLRPSLAVDIGNDLRVVFGVEPFEVIADGLRRGLRNGAYSAWDAITKLRLKLTRRCVSSLITKLEVSPNMLGEMPVVGKLRSTLTDIVKSGRSSMVLSFIIHRFLPLLTTAHWMFLPLMDLVHPRPIRPCDSLTHDTPWIGFARAQMHLFPRQSIPQGSGFSDDRGLGLAAIEPNGRGVEW